MFGMWSTEKTLRKLTKEFQDRQRHESYLNTIFWLLNEPCPWQFEETALFCVSLSQCQDSECVQPVHPGSKEETRLFSFPSAAVRIMPQCVFRLFYIITACWNTACSPPVQGERPIPSFFERGWFGSCGPEQILCCVWHQA